MIDSPRNPMSLSSLVWLRRLRWCALSGQLVLILTVTLFFNVSVPFAELFAVAAVLAFSNLLLYKKSFLRGATQAGVGLLLILDTCLLTLLLYFTGGASNPFSILYIIHVILAAVLLDRVWTWCMTVLSSVAFGLLFLSPGDESMHMHHHGHEGFSLHLYGMWFAFSLVAALVAYFLTRITSALKEQDRQLRDMQIMALQQERLAALTTLAAGAAHELSTPLGTISLVASELMQNELVKSGPENLREDLGIIGSEVERCRLIIDKMGGRLGEPRGEMPGTLRTEDICTDLSSAFRERYGDRLIAENNAPELSVTAPRGSFIQALTALIRNAFDASDDSKPVVLRIGRHGDSVEFIIEDSGSGIDSSVLPQIGHPFFTLKEPGKGMGLGVFLARLVTERIGGSLRYESSAGAGTRAIILLPVNI